MRKVAQVIILVWFTVVSLFIFVPSYFVLSNSLGHGRIIVPDPPPPPKTLSLSPIGTSLDVKVQEQQVASYVQRVGAYTQQVTAYTQELDAYKAQLTALTSDARTSTYEIVVDKTLAPLLNAFFTALIGYVFTNAGSSLLNNYIKAKNMLPLEPVKLW